MDAASVYSVNAVAIGLWVECLRIPIIPSLPEAEPRADLTAIMLPVLLACLGLGPVSSVAEINPAKNESEVVAFDITPKKSEDHVKVRRERDTVIFDVLSRSGIGGAAITRTKGKWPANVILRFRLGGLESLTVSNGKIKLAGSVLSHSGYAKRLSLTEDGKDGEQAPGTQIQVLDAAGKPVPGLPKRGGYFQIAVPKALLESQPKSLELRWVDFFR